MDNVSPLALYQQAMARDGFVSDAAQLRAVELLQTCYQALHQPGAIEGPPRGIYLWGPVGRGKTWLMDIFHRSLQVPSRRQHFHHFMRWVHMRLFALNGTADPLRALASELAEEVRVLCFDELFVADIGDAIILGRLFEVMFEQGVVIVATSNQPPDQLYADGFNRERFLPAITAIEHHMQVVSVDGGADHRLRPGAALQRYWVSDDESSGELQQVFAELAEGTVSNDPVVIGRRSLQVVHRSQSAIWCRFDDLFEQPFSALDFIELCDRFSSILISEVPRLGSKQREGRIARGTEDAAARVEAGDRELPKLAARDDAVRRFIALVDECYDRQVPLYLQAQVPMNELYTQGYLSFAFRRTLSRLREMQLQRFGTVS
ncbi:MULTISPECIES: cell division protein ZapE [Pseudomonadaceae]|uniref:cell division protein ZapE n=1 Tax=Pseudomonadaceae TaxID=135621 RepID=UPI001039EB03|nr:MULTISPECIES: cell division protein ZapE [Pseudomonadaceae]MBA1279323.1 cell division protein ZapE [Stutzerimonas stutzeri]MBC8648591.1 AFG1 family ATPase [Pseudomonas sp. MT4]QXY90524.1 cell division protein ZapE [Pseudomonas sp. MTM4]TCD24412.1 cell division protein ZapE [Pseudomonas sp. IC_126]